MYDDSQIIGWQSDHLTVFFFAVSKSRAGGMSPALNTRPRDPDGEVSPTHRSYSVSNL